MTTACQVIPDFLDGRSCDALLEFAIANEPRFAPTTVDADEDPKPAVRKSRRLLEFGGFKELIEQRAASLVPQVLRQLGLTPFEPTAFELELVAHEHEAFYKRHIDLFTGQAASGSEGGDRLLSIVAYLNRRPKRFSGGELRLFPNPNPAAVSTDFIDIVPEHGLAVAFSSWLPHEVRPVACPSLQFGDARFAINCWALRDRQSAMNVGK